MRSYTFAVRVLLVAVLTAAFAVGTEAQRASRSITVVTEKNAGVWLDGVRHGDTGDIGRLTIRSVAPGPRKLRVRANGFREAAVNVTAAQSGDVRVTLVKTTDQAELAFQEAESADDKEQAVELYQKAIKLRPRFAEAYLGLARVHADQGDYDSARKAIQGARRLRPAYPEVSAVEGRIYKSEGDQEKAIAAFKRSITEGRGVQPEANTGLGLLYKDRAAAAGTSGDFEGEKENYQTAAKYLTSALAQLSGAPDAIVVYQLLGEAYERAGMFPEAIRVYEDFLRIFPDIPEATAVESFIVQLKKKMQEQQ